MHRPSALSMGLMILLLALVSCSDDGPSDPANGAPVITGLAADPDAVATGATASVTCTAVDTDGDALAYAWSAGAGTFAGSGATVDWTAPATAGACTLTCAVSDGEETASGSLVIDVHAAAVPGSLVLVPGGTFGMGDSYAEGADDELPRHTVTLSSFLIGQCEVTQAEWTAYMPAGTYDQGAGPTHPAYSVGWFGILAYCNHRSLDEGLTPCYSIGGSTDPDAWGALPIYGDDPTFAAWDAVICDWDADGYRLPTEAEWEYAARGGDAHDEDDYRYSGSATLADVAWYDDDTSGPSRPVGGKRPNPLGLFDMSGNVYEFCWDRYAAGYYATCDALGTVADPRGPDAGDMRVERGGDWSGVSSNCRVAARFRDYPVSRFPHTGFRVARTP